jgi:hypothetical protein
MRGFLEDHVFLVKAVVTPWPQVARTPAPSRRPNPIRLQAEDIVFRQGPVGCYTYHTPCHTYVSAVS